MHRQHCRSSDDSYDYDCLLKDDKSHTSNWTTENERDRNREMEIRETKLKFNQSGWDDDSDMDIPVPDYRVLTPCASECYLPEVEQENKLPQKAMRKKKRTMCKCCNLSKQCGRSSCPIHLPGIQSRYLRVLEDKSRNALTIHLFRNGDYRITPTMVHIPKIGMRSMDDIMQLIDKFVRFPVGYAYALYSLMGDVVEDPKDLEPYETYVVVNNCKRNFIPMEYGRKKPSASIYLTRSRPRKYPSYVSFHSTLTT